eukprot:366293-Chlamydomonas_euryale.AAC.9
MPCNKTTKTTTQRHNHWPAPASTAGLARCVCTPGPLSATPRLCIRKHKAAARTLQSARIRQNSRDHPRARQAADKRSIGRNKTNKHTKQPRSGQSLQKTTSQGPICHSACAQTC